MRDGVVLGVYCEDCGERIDVEQDGTIAHISVEHECIDSRSVPEDVDADINMDGEEIIPVLSDLGFIHLFENQVELRLEGPHSEVLKRL